jgi:osmoprotectant transport system permease protein
MREKRPLSGFAVASAILGLLGVLVLAIPFALIGLSRVESRDLRGRRFAYAGLGLSAVWALVLVVVILSRVNLGDIDVSSFFKDFGGAIEFLFKPQPSQLDPNTEVGGISEMLSLTLKHIALSVSSLALGIAVALPLGLYLGHHGKGEFAAINISNVGRAVPTLVLLTVFIAYVGVGFVPIMISLALLALPPVLTNTWVAVRQVERDSVDAARGMGMTHSEIIRRVELPLSLPTIFAGIRVAAVNVVATATIAPLGSVDSLGTPIISGNVYGADGRLGAAIAVSVLTLLVSASLAGLQKAATPKGLKMGADKPRRRRLLPKLRRRETATP